MTEINCDTSKGGAVYGKVFHDANRNGVFDFGETGFHSPNQQVLLELVDCSPFSINCDEYDYGDNVNFRRRTVSASLPGETGRSSRHCPDTESGGCFEFVCPDCFGQYQLVLSRLIDPEVEGWKNSPVKIGGFREGWALSPEPPCSCDVHNNFENFRSQCFSMFNDLNRQEPFEVVLDLGIYFDREIFDGTTDGIVTTMGSISITHESSSTTTSTTTSLGNSSPNFATTSAINTIENTAAPNFSTTSTITTNENTLPCQNSQNSENRVYQYKRKKYRNHKVKKRKSKKK